MGNNMFSYRRASGIWILFEDGKHKSEYLKPRQTQTFGLHHAVLGIEGPYRYFAINNPSCSTDGGQVCRGLLSTRR